MAKYIETFTEEELASEVWRWIPSCPGYAASSLARIGSCLVLGRGKPSIAGQVQRIISPSLFVHSKTGHRDIRVSLGMDGKSVTKCRSHLVAEAFLGPRPAGLDVMHGPFDGTQEDSINDRPENLRYGTRSENLKMSIAHKNAARKKHFFTDDQVRQIRQLISQGIPDCRIAEQFNAINSMIRQIRVGLTYTDVV